MALSSALLLLLSAGSALAQSGSASGSGGLTTSVFLPLPTGTGGTPALTAAIPVVQLGSVSQSRTTYAVGCAQFAANPALSSALCADVVKSLTFTAGPSLIQATIEAVTAGVTARVEQSCAIQGSTQAVCRSIVAADRGPLAITTTTSSTYTGQPTLNFVPIRVTGTTTAAAPTGSSANSPSSSTNPNAAAPGHAAGFELGWLATLMGLVVAWL